MSKGIRSYPESERNQVIKRRVEQKSGGLGYLAALDFQNKGKSNEGKSKRNVKRFRVSNVLRRSKINAENLTAEAAIN